MYGAFDRTDSFGSPFIHELCVKSSPVHPTLWTEFNGKEEKSHLVKAKLYYQT
jgi:hypothetical protein